MRLVGLSGGRADPHATTAAFSVVVAVAEGDEGAEGGREAGQPQREVLGAEGEGGRGGRAEKGGEYRIFSHNVYILAGT